MQRLSQALLWAGAELHGADAAVSGASIDTRSLLPGQLFVALPGARVDGHDFVARAAEAGAAGALVNRIVDCQLPQLLVADVLQALQAIATHWRQLWAELSGGKLVGVTGSNGKTSVKAMLASVLQQGFSVFATPGNLNNHIGVPLSLLNLRPDHQRAVIEMGANHPGEIAELAEIAKPDVGVVTNAGDAHLEGFGSRDGVARAKGELFAALGAGQTAIINADDVYAPLWRELAAPASCISFGRHDADVLAANERDGAFQLQTPLGSCAVSLQLSGSHNIMNALAAAAALIPMGCDLEQIKTGLELVAPVQGRLQAVDLSGVQLINDAYNANPDSVLAAIEVLAQCVPVRHLVIGDMAELGEVSDSAHAQIGVQAREHGIEQLWTCGVSAQLAAQAFGDGAQSFDSQAELAAELRQCIKAGDSVLVKGSRSAQMERVVSALQEAG